MNMHPELFILLISIPTVIFSFIISILGVMNLRHWFIVAGVVLFIPITFFLNGVPGFNGIALIFPLLMIGSAVAVRAKRKFWAWILLLPSFIVEIWFSRRILELVFLIVSGGL